MAARQAGGMNMKMRNAAPGITTGEAGRKALHIGVGLLALTLRWLNWYQALAACAAAFLMNWLVLPRITHHLLEHDDERSRGFSAGIILYPVSVGIMCALFGSRMEVVAAAWALLAFGDGFATLAGRSLGGPRLPWNHDKTLAGFLGFIGAGGVGASLLSLWVRPGQDPAVVAYMCYAAALMAALIESTPTGINDNLSVPLMSGGFLFALTYVSGAQLSDRADLIFGRLAAALAVNLLVSGLAWFAKSVSASGAIVGLLIGVTVWVFGGWQAYLILILFFVVGSGATRVRYERKAARRIAQEDGGRRGARHAIANCGVPAFLAFISAGALRSEIFLVGLAAALATAVFDTVSSEIGQVYGRRTFLITTFRRVPPGTDGAVSVEGTLAGLAAAALLSAAALAAGLMGPLGLKGASIVVVAAFVGTTVESYLGATVEAMDLIDNEAMNFINTLVGALVAIGLCVLMGA